VVTAGFAWSGNTSADISQGIAKIDPHSRPDKLQIVDGPLAEAKLMARVHEELTQHLGGKPSATQRILIDRDARRIWSIRRAAWRMRLRHTHEGGNPVKE
jgi:hypothetical protein